MHCLGTAANDLGKFKMAFLCKPVVETRFKSLKDVDIWLSAGEDRLERVSIADWIEKGVRFFDDEYFGNDDRFLRFNQKGIRFTSVHTKRFDQEVRSEWTEKKQAYS